jgi:hypothetical protein
MKKTIIACIVLLTITIIDCARFGEGAFYLCRVCVDGYEYVIGATSGYDRPVHITLVQSFIEKRRPIATVPKTCEQKGSGEDHGQ